MLAERLFVAFDSKKNGVIDIDEFLTGVAVVLAGTPEEKADFIYTMFNLDADEGVSREELNTMLNSVMHSAAEVVAAIDGSPSNSVDASINGSVADNSGKDVTNSFISKQKSMGPMVSRQMSNITVGSPLFGKPLRRQQSNISVECSTSSPTRAPMVDILATTTDMESSKSFEHKMNQAVSPGISQRDSTTHGPSVPVDITGRTVSSVSSSAPSNGISPKAKPGAKKNSLTVSGSIASSGSAEFAVDNSEFATDLSLKHRSISHEISMPSSVPMQVGNGTVGSEKGSVVSVKNLTEVQRSDISSPLMTRRANMRVKGSGGNVTISASQKGLENLTTVGELVKEMVDQAFAKCDVSRTGKLNHKEFKNWLANNESVLDSIFSAECFSKHRFLGRKMPVDREVKAGYLYKATTHPVKPYKKRWYKVTRQFLYYFEKKNDRTPSGAIYLPGAYIAVYDAWKDSKDSQRHGAKGKRYGFSVTSNHNTHVLYCDPDIINEAQIWVDTINKNNDLSDIKDWYLFNTDGNVDKLGSGGFSHVYRAVFKNSGERVAVKMIDKRPLDPVEREGMLAEVAILKLTNHINVVGLFEVYDTKSHMYLVMEECEGGELLKYCKDGPLPVRTYVCILHQMFEGLRYLHEIGIVHRDIKPSNLLVTSSDLANADLKIVDFGFSKFVRPSERLNDTVGTLKYNAPEIINTDVAYGKPVDMWFDEENREYRALPDEAKSLIRSCLRVSAKTRPTAEEVLRGDFFKLYEEDLMQMNLGHELSTLGVGGIKPIAENDSVAEDTTPETNDSIADGEETSAKKR
ncbi:serine/threonine protein kinase [Sphaeroforma arctica JP610]|uniref:Serine/threonine protein kinase n=1 Tax=Sphaeroforma arctica JP610 TaxID=667725 RepID=A0A0L0GG51_9EUKA|nr:serine/threonine protein kinase [Sphaeroforma arctica JP610]KNC87263.1 serine/threonine protein kinase [Sphaeroforma arctica JP610]|eukprot:XP_014161165.1 serine/threonine protein kinase [Sphaeroforma arctica JP610]